MNKKQFKVILDKYSKAENIITQLDGEFGINLYYSSRENFYNLYNYIIFKLFEQLYGEYGRELIENYLFEETNITFDELCIKLNINE